MMALRQAYSLSSIWMSLKGFTNSSKILVATRAISSSGQCIGMMKSFPGETREAQRWIFILALRTRSHPALNPATLPDSPSAHVQQISSMQLHTWIHDWEASHGSHSLVLNYLICTCWCTHTVHKACSTFCSGLPSVIASICLQVVLHLYFWCGFF